MAPLPDGIVAFAGLDSALSNDDLAPLVGMIGDAQYIGIGESVHTSGGYYAFKERLIRALIEDHGIRVLAMETPRLRAAPVESYLQTCQGNVDSVLTSIFTVFVDDHTVALMAWICQFNQQHPNDPVHFYGFDEQEDNLDSQDLSTWLTAAAPAAAPALLAATAPCHTSEHQDYDSNDNLLPYSDADFAACNSALTAVDSYIADNKATLVAASSAAAEATAEIDSIGLAAWQSQDYYAALDTPASYASRDIAMYQIFAGLRDLHFPGQKAIIWAHDYHLSADHADAVDYVAGVQTFGTQLRAAVGAAYFPIGLIGYNVSINWPNVGKGAQPLPDPGSVEATLHALDQPYLFANPHDAWLVPGEYYEITGKQAMFAVPSTEYDALVYLENSPGMNSPYWGAGN